MLRHTRPDTTLENYVKDVPASVFAMSDAMYEQMAGPPDEKQGLVMIQAPGGCTVTRSNLAGNCTHSEHASQEGQRKSFEIWCARRDSNSRPIAPEAIALSI
jgi:hypothetical protein